jgi:hypothetical protein
VGQKHEVKPAYNKTHDKKKYFGKIIASKSCTGATLVHAHDTKNTGKLVISDFESEIQSNNSKKIN